MDTEESTSVMDNHETLISTTDVELLKRAWCNEKSAPEILQFEVSLVQRIKDQIELASESVSKRLKLFVVLGLCKWIVGMIFVISESVTERHASINLRTDDK